MNKRFKFIVKKIFKPFLPILRKGFLKYRKYKSDLTIQKRLQILKNRINSLNLEKVILIKQPTFFSIDGKHFYAGGAERYVLDLSKIIRSQGYNPILIQLGTNWNKEKDGLNILSVDRNVFHEISNSSLFKEYPIIFSYYPMIEDNISRANKILVLSHGVYWDSPHDVFDHNKLSRHYELLKSINQIISVDTNTINWIRATFPDLKKSLKMNYVPNYVDLNQFKKKSNISENIRILFPRRAETARGYWLISGAIEPLMKKYKNLEFHFVGFVHEDDIEKDMNRLKELYKDRIKAIAVAPEEMEKVYNNADIAVIPSIASEGTSLSCLEAMACGNAVITTNVGGLPNLVINNYNGFLINPNKYDLINALDELLSSSSLREKFSRNALDIAKAFDKNHWELEWKEILNQFFASV